MRGGKRSGSGRKPGAVTKKTRAIADKAIDEGITPLEVMLRAMRGLADAGNWVGAADVAKDAAPYVHPRLSAITQEISGKDGAPVIERIERVIVDPKDPDAKGV